MITGFPTIDFQLNLPTKDQHREVITITILKSRPTNTGGFKLLTNFETGRFEENENANF